MPCFQRAVPRTFAGLSSFLIPWVYSTRCASRPLPSLFSFFWCFHAPLRNGSGYIILSVEVGK